MLRLHPDPGPTTVDEELDAYRPWREEREGRPFVAVNFAATVDGRATIDGVSGPIGSGDDTAMLVGLRSRFDSLMIGAGTMRAERYGRIVSDPGKRARREDLGLPADPLMVLVSGRLDLPWDAPLFTAGGGQVLIFTAADEAEVPETATTVDVIRHEGGVDLAAALRHLREERGVRSVLCEGGPRLHGELQSGGLVDDLFLTVAPKLAGGGAPRIVEGDLPAVTELELARLLSSGSELLARYSRR